MKKFVLAQILLLCSQASFAAKAQTFKLDAKASKATWEGRKLAGAHQGTLQFRQGSLHLEGGKLAGGEVVIDMTSLKNTDQEGDMNAKLVNHLKSDDFFSVEKHPTSTLKITKVEQTGEKATVNGELTIKGVTKPISFPAEIKVEGKRLSAKGEMKVDRTLYGIKFRSLKFFSDIGDKVINDEFTVGFDITASK